MNTEIIKENIVEFFSDPWDLQKDQHFVNVIQKNLNYVLKECKGEHIPFVSMAMTSNEDGYVENYVPEDAPFQIKLVELFLEHVPNIDTFILAVMDFCKNNNLEYGMEESYVLKLCEKYNLKQIIEDDGI